MRKIERNIMSKDLHHINQDESPFNYAQEEAAVTPLSF